MKVVLQHIEGNSDSGAGIYLQTLLPYVFTMGATWLRRGLQSSVVHAEVQLPRKTAENQ